MNLHYYKKAWHLADIVEYRIMLAQHLIALINILCKEFLLQSHSAIIFTVDLEICVVNLKI